MATTFRYIKALVPIRLFNGALWMEEEDINRIPESMFQTTEIQTAISNHQLIEVNNNDLPLDVVSPTLKWKGDWDATDGQLPIGRRIGDVFRIIGPGTVNNIELVIGQLVFFRSLSEFDFLGFTNEELMASQYIFKTTGDWTPSGSMANAIAIRSDDGQISISGDSQLLEPNPVLLNLGAVSIASSGVGIQVTGSDIVWSSIVAPSVLLTDNLQEYGLFFLNESSEPTDFSIVATGGIPTNACYGGVVTIGPNGFTSYAIVNGVPTNLVNVVFDSSVAGGDLIYVGLDRLNSRLLVQKNSETVKVGAYLIFNGLPEGETLFASVYTRFTSSTTVFGQGYLEFNLSPIVSGKSPLQAMGPVEAPPGAEEGKEYRVLANAKYGDYYLKYGDIVKFFNGVEDVVITRLPEVHTEDIPPGILSLGYDKETQQLTIARVFANGKTDSLSTLIETASASGFVCVTDVTPQNLGDNVGNKVTTDSGNVLVSCTSGTSNIRVHVLATTGSKTLKPAVTVNGNTVTNLSVSEARCVWVGYYDLSISGNTSIVVQHGEGAETTCLVTYEAPPVVQSAYFLGAYPAIGQTEYPSGQSVQVIVTSSLGFVEVEAQSAVDTATAAFSSGPFASVLSKTVTLTTADRGTSTQHLPARVRIRNATGTWSAWYDTNTGGSVDHVNTLALNNSVPAVTFSSVVYPEGQQAIKNGDTATLHITFSNCDEAAFTSATLTFSAPSSVTNQGVSLAAAGLNTYTVSGTNVSVTVRKISNNVSRTFTTLVNIADADPVITLSLPAARLRSGGTNGTSPQNHTITLSSTQRLLSVGSLDKTIGTWVGSWSTVNGGLTNTKTLQISDTDAKGMGTFSNLSVTNLAGKVITTISGSDTYTVGGFVQRTITVAAWGVTQNREADIGTYVTNTSKLLATNLSKTSQSGSHNTTFRALTTPDEVDRFTITGPAGVYNPGGRILYNLDLTNAATNTSGTAQFEIEEIV